MHPVLFKIGILEIHSYGLMLAVSFLIGIYWGMYRAKKREIPENYIMDLALIIVACAIVGSRLFYVITHVNEFSGHWIDTINPMQSDGTIGLSGLSMLGGVVMVLIAIVVFARIKQVSLVRLCDVLTPCFALGIGLTRIGCFLNGCCYGVPCTLPWAVTFPPESAAGFIHAGTPIHPTQIYAALYGFLILALLIIADRKSRFDGMVMSLFFILYGLSRFLVDFVRDYESSVQFQIFTHSFTFNQAISLGMFILGLALFLLLPRRKAVPKQEQETGSKESTSV